MSDNERPSSNHQDNVFADDRESESWLSLLEYSTKHNVSISTLRRRIRSNTVNFRLDDGRYMILDAPLDERELPMKPAKELTQVMMDELKRAYSMILQEKEEQVCQLREEIADLRTLVRVLEAENLRLTK